MGFFVIIYIILGDAQICEAVVSGRNVRQVLCLCPPAEPGAVLLEILGGGRGIGQPHQAPVSAARVNRVLGKWLKASGRRYSSGSPRSGGVRSDGPQAISAAKLGAITSSIATPCRIQVAVDHANTLVTVADRCAYPFLPLPHRPSPKSQRVGYSTLFRSTTSEREVFRGCSHLLIFRPPSLLPPRSSPPLGHPYRMLRAAVAFTSEHSAVCYLPAHRIC
jgi:hypothetical protein